MARAMFFYLKRWFKAVFTIRPVETHGMGRNKSGNTANFYLKGDTI
jgi:hypothetical protein